MNRYLFKIYCLCSITTQITYSWVPLCVSKITPLDRMKQLELVWKIREEMDDCDVSKGDICGDKCVNCGGNGEIQCNYCRGTGFLMLGDELIGTNNDCPACKGKCMIECKKCMGAGYIVEWRKNFDNNINNVIK